MQTITNTITVAAEEFAKYKKLKAEEAACKKQADAIKKGWGLPEAAEIAEAREYVIVNGNGDEQGKYTIYFVKEFTRKAGWAARVS